MILQDKRNFSAILFQSFAVNNLDDLNKQLPKRYISKGDIVYESESDLEVAQVFYYSNKRYSMSPYLDKLLVERRGTQVFAYTVYLVVYPLNGKYYSLIATPYHLLLRDLFESIRSSLRSPGIFYIKTNLHKLMGAIINNKHLGGKVKLTHLELLVSADSAVQNISLVGQDVLHSKTYKHLSDALVKTGISLDPRCCCVKYDDYEGKRFSFRTDQFGNYAFRVGKEGRNLLYSKEVISYLVDESLITATIAFPHLREIPETGEEIDTT